MNSKVFFKSLFVFYRFLVRRLKVVTHASTPYATKSSRRPSLDDLVPTGDQALVCGLEGGLLRSTAIFPYFMLVALEGGSILRGLLLLLMYPMLCLLSYEMGLRVMVLVSFCGLKKDRFRLGRAVLPKFFLEDVSLEVFEVMRRHHRVICLSCMPRVMVEGFLREYMEVEVVVANELEEFKGYYLGWMENSKNMEKLELIKDHGCAVVAGIGSFVHSFHELLSCCKEVYISTSSERKKWRTLPRAEYPKPLVFHDGRIAFKPTPAATLAMFVWLPLAVPLAVLRAAIFILLPYHVSVPLVAFLGMHNRLISAPLPLRPNSSGRIFVCNHRTLLDPLYISACVDRHLTATTYSISRVSELISPIRTIRLTRNREVDKATMEKLLQEGDLAVCPEGTTCREPYLLRFSPLFAELERPVSPVALEAMVSMFYGTTAGGWKSMDPLYFLMNPKPSYTVEFLEKVEMCVNTDQGNRDIANYVQRQIGMVLGFECTKLTRRDKYLMLAGNEGIVDAKDGGKKV